MKKLSLILSLMLFWGLALAQSSSPLSETQGKEVVAQLTEMATSIKTMQCHFTQQKTMSMLAEPSVSEGTLQYASPDRMRWEYDSPYSVAFIVNGEKTTRLTEGKAEPLDAKSGIMYQAFAKTILGCASGINLFDKSMFYIALFDDENLWKAEMTPKRHEMKRMLAKLVFYFDKKSRTIKKVDFVESSGDVTKIHFTDIRINEEMEEKVFEQP